jgi:hypothetical protein
VTTLRQGVGFSDGRDSPHGSHSPAEEDVVRARRAAALRAEATHEERAALFVGRASPLASWSGIYPRKAVTHQGRGRDTTVRGAAPGSSGSLKSLSGAKSNELKASGMVRESQVEMPYTIGRAPGLLRR